MKISFVIPCYRSEHTIEGVVSELKSVVAQRPEVDYEIIMVSDHSPDKVYDVIARVSHADPMHLKGIQLARNFGQPSALMAGFSRVSGDVVFCLDDDGQAPVDAVFTVIDKLVNEKFDVVYGEYPHKHHSLFRNLGSDVNHLMAVWLIGKPKSIRTTSFLAVRRFVVEEMKRYTGPFPYIGGIIFRTTKNIGAVVVNHRDRVDGESGYTIAKLVGLMMNGFTAFSVKPLRLASLAGSICAVLGMSFGLWTVIAKFIFGKSIAAGYSSLMSAILFVGGMIMLILGLIGEYVGRIYICLNNSPQYVISEETTEGALQ